MPPERFGFFQPTSVKVTGVAAILSIALLVIGVSSTRAAKTAPPSDQTYDPSSFLGELARLQENLESAGKSPEALRAYREALPKSWTVIADGRRFDVPTDVLGSRIEQAEGQSEFRREQLQQAREYLQALAAETASLSASPAPADSAQSKLDAILSRPEYTHARRESWFDRLRDRIGEVLSDAMDRIFGKIGGEKSLGYALLWIGVAGAAILSAYWVFRDWLRAARMAEMDLGAESIPLLSWQKWIFEAREAAGRGDYRMAVHCAYWAGIVRLQDLGALAPGHAKTPREYLRAFTESKLVVSETLIERNQALARLTSRLEQTWYGYQPATDTDFRDSLAQLEILGCHLR